MRATGRRRLGYVLWIVFLFTQGSSAADLDHTKWRLVDVSPDGLDLPAGSNFDIRFEEGKLNVSACNMHSGKYVVESDRLLAPGPFRSTRKACADRVQHWDGELLKLIENHPGIRVDGKRLTLAGSNKAEWSFTAEPMPSENAKIEFIYVASTLKDCQGAMPMKCLQVRKSKSDSWMLHYSGIAGFEYVPGIQYRLRIKEDRNPRPAADASSIEWYLDAVIEQTVIDRKAADDYLASQNK